MSVKRIEEKFDKPISEIPTKKLAYFLLELFSENKSRFTVYSLFLRMSNSDDHIFEVLSEALQWLRNKGLIMEDMRFTGSSYCDLQYFITRKGKRYLNDSSS